MGDGQDHIKNIVGCSPFTKVFKKVFKKVYSDVTSVLKEEKQQHSDDNPYYCPDIIVHEIFNHMALYPLWSGFLLGNLKRYSSDKRQRDFLHLQSATLETLIAMLKSGLES